MNWEDLRYYLIMTLLVLIVIAAFGVMIWAANQPVVYTITIYPPGTELP